MNNKFVSGPFELQFRNILLYRPDSRPPDHVSDHDYNEVVPVTKSLGLPLALITCLVMLRSSRVYEMDPRCDIGRSRL